MPFVSTDGLEYFQFASLANYPVVQGIFTRKGGVSPDPWKSLNLGGTVGDSRSNVIENRKRIFSAVQREVTSHFDVWQVHGTDILIPNQPRGMNEPHLRADAILTDKPEITLFMRFADCVPIFLYDSQQHIVGMVHAGWQGTVKKIAAKAINQMQEKYHSKPEKICAGIGPSIGAHHYEVKSDVQARFRAVFSKKTDALIIPRDGKLWLDLWQANTLVLNSVGVFNVEVAQVCTACDLNRWYSHRAEGGKTGRFGAALGLMGR